MRRRYSEAEIANALAMMALHNGSAKTASEKTGIPYDTLVGWKLKHRREQYGRIRDQLQEELSARAGEDIRQILEDQHELLRRLTTKAMGDVDKLAPHQVLRAQKDAWIGLGVGHTKVQELTGQPTTIVEHRSVAEIERRLKVLGVLDIESTAEEVEPQQIEAKTAEVKEFA